MCVSTGQLGLVQKFGKYIETIQPGFTLVAWPMTTVTMVSVSVQQFDFTTDTKTKDDVTVQVKTQIQWSVDPEKVDKFYFGLSNPSALMGAVVDDNVRGQIPSMELDAVFASKVTLADSITQGVSSAFAPYGMIIVRSLVTDIAPDRRVLDAMNAINASKREREAAIQKAEADKILLVKRAEAEAESKYLMGVGTAKMRVAITDGFKGSIDSMKESCGMEPAEVVHMMLVTQYMDVLKEFAASGSSSIVVQGGPAGLASIEDQVRSGFQQATMIAGAKGPAVHAMNRA